MQYTVNFTFIEKLGMFSFDALEFDGNFLSGCHVCPQVNVSEGTAANFAAKPVLFPDAQLHCMHELFDCEVSLLYIYALGG